MLYNRLMRCAALALALLGISSPDALAAVPDYDGAAKLKAASADIPNWMSYLPDNMFAAHLSIPGTHDTMTAESWVSNTASTASKPATQSVAQSVKLAEQMEKGIRALDFRPALYNDALYCAHGLHITTVTMIEAFDQIKQYLTDHPSEFFFIHFFRGNVYADDVSFIEKRAGKIGDDTSRAQYNKLMGDLFNEGGRYDSIVIDFSPLPYGKGNARPYRAFPPRPHFVCQPREGCQHGQLGNPVPSR